MYRTTIDRPGEGPRHEKPDCNTVFDDLAVANRNTQLYCGSWVFDGEPGGDLLSHTRCALSSARFRFTVLFEKGRGGSETLWPPSITCSFVAWCGERKTGRRGLLVVIVYELRCS